MIDSIIVIVWHFNCDFATVTVPDQRKILKRRPAPKLSLVPQRWSRKLLLCRNNLILVVVFFDMYLNVSLGNILIAPSKLSEFDHDFIDIVHGDFL